MNRLKHFWALLLSLVLSPAGAELLISDFNSNVVRRYNATNGAFIDVFVPNTNGLLNLPHGLAFGPDGNLYVASAGNDCVLRYNGTNGAFLDVFASTGLDYPVRLIFRPDGLLYVSSQLNDRVLRFDATNGSFVDVFVTNSPALDGPSDMTFGPDGNLYVVGRFNNRVARYNGVTGAFMDVFVTDNLAQPFGLRFSSTHDLLVVSGNEGRLNRFAGASGEFISAFTTNGTMNLPIGVVYGPDGNLYVAGFGAQKVARYDAITGAFLEDFVAAGSGGLSGPNFMLFRPPVSVAPRLSVAVTNSSLVISWPAKGIPGVVEKSATIAHPSWAPVTNAIASAALTNSIVLPLGTADFFRLRLLE
jgi:DNA-binding beta-propeller fold protein YncE